MGLCYSNCLDKSSTETIDTLIVIKDLLCKKKEELINILEYNNKKLLQIAIILILTNIDVTFSDRLMRINIYIELICKKISIERQLNKLNIDISDISVQIDVLQRLYKLIDFDIPLYR